MYFIMITNQRAQSCQFLIYDSYLSNLLFQHGKLSNLSLKIRNGCFHSGNITADVYICCL